MYCSPETVSRKSSLVKLRLHVSGANDVTEARNVSVFFRQREIYELGLRGTLSE